MRKHITRFTMSGLHLLLLAHLLISCAVNPVTGKREISLLSESDEIRLGAEADKSIVAQYGLYDDPQLAEYINDLGQKMAAISHRPNLEWHFRVLDSPVVNAFALPGGYTYITRGILGYMNSEAELAGVIGHEIGHVTARHGAKAYTRAQLAQVGFTAGYMLSETFRQFGQLAETGVGLLFLSFSRAQESQSDELGVSYSTAVGYDATHMSHFFGTLNRLSEKSGQSLPSFLSTHPNPEDREERTMELAQKAKQESQLQNFKKGEDSYLKLIDGIVYGEDPRQGFVENGYFYHPTLDFQFPVPTGWQLMNTPQLVMMVNEEQTAGIQFTLAQEKSARQAADAFIANTQAQLLQSDATRINGLTAEMRESMLTTQEGSLKVLSYFIEKDSYVYTFHGFSAPANYDGSVGAFRYTMTNFDRLRNAAARNKKPTRIKVVTVTQRTTLQEFLAAYPTDKTTTEDLAIINGMQLTDTVQPGDKIKVLSD